MTEIFSGDDPHAIAHILGLEDEVVDEEVRRVEQSEEELRISLDPKMKKLRKKMKKEKEKAMKAAGKTETHSCEEEQYKHA